MKYFSTFFLLLFLVVSFLMPAQQITFSDVADQMGINHPFTFIRGSISFNDFNSDGKDDLSFSSNEGLPLFIYRNDDVQFTDVTNELGLIDTLRTMNILWSDYDNDGDKDLFAAVDDGITYSRLYRNDGVSGFIDVTISAGLSTNLSSANAACWGDYNNDGWIDLYVTNYSEFERNYLYANNGNGTFTDVTETAGVNDTTGVNGIFKLPLAVVFFDYNNDGWQDIYIANDHFTGNTLFENNGDGTFDDVSDQTNSAMGGFMMGIAVGDYDNNGFLDLYLSNDPFGNFLLKNNGDETFTEVAVNLGLTVNKACWGTNFFDYDNDTDLDLYVCASVGPFDGINEFFENNGNGTFTRLLGIGLDEDYKSFGMGIGDFNNDGFYDMAVNNQQVLPNLFMNSGGANNWVKLNLVGVESNRDGIGSWIEVYNNGSMFIRETHCGISYMSQNSSSIILGAGTDTSIDSIIINWPGSGIVDVLRNVTVNQTITVEEGSTDPIPVELTSFAASVNDGEVTLSWSTSTETNNQGFEVERNSGDGFQKIGFVAGFGTTTEIHSYSYVDGSLREGSYTYRLKQIDYDGTFEYSDVIEVDVTVPKVFSLEQNYPNPFNPNTQINFSLAVDSKVSLTVFDILGQEVSNLISGNLSAGIHEINFNASNINSGVYFYRIDAAGVDGTNFTSVKKMILTK